jgi:hypothetical protein
LKNDQKYAIMLVKIKYPPKKQDLAIQGGEDEPGILGI